MKANDLKKGMVVKLRGGGTAKMMDNKRGNIRMIQVETPWGIDIGSEYIWKIQGVYLEDGEFEYIELTEKQMHDANFVNSIFR